MKTEENQLLGLINGGGSVSFHPECAKYASSDDNSLKELIIFNFKDQKKDVGTIISDLELIKEQFLRYFDIFQTPVVLIEFHDFRFGKIILPTNVIERYDIFFSNSKLENHRMMLFQLLANVYEFARQELKRWSDPEILNSMRKFIPEVNQIIYLKKRIREVEPSQSINLKVSITVNSDEPLVFKNQMLIHDFILQDFSNIKSSDIEPNLSKRIDLMPYQNDYETYFRNKLITSIHNFLCNETNIKPAPGKKTSEEQLFIISDFMELCKIELIDKNNNPVDDESHRWGIIKNIILRHRSSNNPLFPI